MALRLEDKQKAIKLRIEGKSYGEIRSIITNLSKGTLSGWLKSVKLTKEQEESLKRNLEKIGHSARIKSAWTKNKRRQERKEKALEAAGKEYSVLSKNPFFLVGLALYWAEGNKKTEVFQFTNSDPSAVKLILSWLEQFCGIPRRKVAFRVYIHKIYATENCEEFWSKITRIPVNNFRKTIYKPTPHKIKRNSDYKGCVQIRFANIELFWKVTGWIKNLIKEHA